MKQSTGIGIVIGLLIASVICMLLYRPQIYRTVVTCPEYGHSKCYDCENHTASVIEYQLGFPAPSPKMGHV